MALLERAKGEPAGELTEASARPATPGADTEFRHVPTIAFAGIVVVVLAFSGAWLHGHMTLDGVGAVMFVRESLSHWFVNGHVPYWLSDMWTGTPLFSMAPSLPTLELVPLAAVVGPEASVRIAILLAQIVGGWGAYVLAANLWGRRNPAAAVAGFIYALHPLFITHGALFGHEPALWVMAATPWVAWSFRRALREQASGYVAVAGVTAGLAIIHQAEHAYALVMLCACMLAIDLAGAWREHGKPAVKAVLCRAAAAAGVGVGVCAFWLFPFLTMSKSFVLTPASSAKAELTSGFGAVFGRHPETWLIRSGGAHGVASFENLLETFGPRTGLSRGVFYLSLVCFVLTIVTVLFLPRRDRDGHLTAIIIASALGLWLSSGGVSLASSQMATNRRFAPVIVVGVVSALLVYAFVRRLAPGRKWVAPAASLLFLVFMPYVTPLVTLQRFVPFLSNIRFPRFYPVAMLGLALGAAYPLVLVQQRVVIRRPHQARVITIGLSLALCAAYLVDISPYRSYYWLQPPATEAAYASVRNTLASVGPGFRVASTFGDPRTSEALLENGEVLTMGWPHAMASKRVWRMTAEALVAPDYYRDLALGLSGTAYIAVEGLDSRGDAVQTVQLVRNAAVRPLVRAYDQVVVANTDEIAPELTVALAPKNVSVVSGGRGVAKDLGRMSMGNLGADVCQPGRLTVAPDLARELAMACTAHQWIGIYDGRTTVPLADAGGVFTAPADGLGGVAVWLDRPAGEAELSLLPVNDDGTLGPELGHVTSTLGGGGNLATFTFGPLEATAGQKYAFRLSCARCPSGAEPRMFVADAQRGPGNLLQGDALDRHRVADFQLMYEGVPTLPASETQVSATTSDTGRWDIHSSGPRPSLVVVASAWFPGWQARVDGKPAKVLIADGAFLGVAVPAGIHHVTLVYKKPIAASVGLFTTFATLVGVLAFLPGVRRRWQPWLLRRWEASQGEG